MTESGTYGLVTLHVGSRVALPSVTLFLRGVCSVDPSDFLLLEQLLPRLLSTRVRRYKRSFVGYRCSSLANYNTTMRMMNDPRCTRRQPVGQKKRRCCALVSATTALLSAPFCSAAAFHVNSVVSKRRVVVELVPHPAVAAAAASDVAVGHPRRSLHVLQSRRSSKQDEEPEKPPLIFGIPNLDRRINNASKEEASPSDFSFPFGIIPSLDTAVLANQLLTFTEPVQDALDGVTDGWALSYADLSPENPQTLPGLAFLSTNAAYLVAGVLLTIAGDFWFGFWTEVAAIASFNYHYNQLLQAGTAKAGTVRLALVLDYFAAAVSMLTAAIYLLGNTTLPIEALGVSAAGLFFLYLSWVWEYGRPYMIWHSLWHLCSAYAGYLIGTMHSAGGGGGGL